MKRPVVLAIILVLGAAAAFAQKTPNRYEVELIENPNPGKKDTRQINCVLVFEKDSVKVISRRSSEVYREFKYSEIKTIEHSFSKNVFFPTDDTLGAAIAPRCSVPRFSWRKKKSTGSLSPPRTALPF